MFVLTLIAFSQLGLSIFFSSFWLVFFSAYICLSYLSYFIHRIFEQRRTRGTNAYHIVIVIVITDGESTSMKRGLCGRDWFLEEW